MVPTGSKAFLLFLICSINLMIGFLEKKTQVCVRRKMEPDSGIIDKVRWEKTVIKLCHISLWLGFLAGVIMGI